MAEIRWFGHNCFRIRSRDATILMDPVGKKTGYSLPKQTADIVTVSHDHPGHTNTSALKGEYKTISGPGEYELNDTFVTGVRTYHDAIEGAERGYNTVYLVEVEGMIVCHLGDLGHPLESEHVEALAQCDILMIPIGGGSVLTPEQAAEVVSLLEPRIVIPMQFATTSGDKSLSPLSEFIGALGAEAPEPVEKLTVRSSDLGEAMRLVVLKPDGEA
jgi:L-ascorbate metabolism protein UlaG (beta-lactamase superfamily)